jgi:hypothetical protein
MGFVACLALLSLRSPAPTVIARFWALYHALDRPPLVLPYNFLSTVDAHIAERQLFRTGVHL